MLIGPLLTRVCDVGSIDAVEPAPLPLVIVMPPESVGAVEGEVGGPLSMTRWSVLTTCVFAASSFDTDAPPLPDCMVTAPAKINWLLPCTSDVPVAAVS